MSTGCRGCCFYLTEKHRYQLLMRKLQKVDSVENLIGNLKEHADDCDLGDKDLLVREYLLLICWMRKVNEQLL